jgi:hypothetical protein
MTAVAVRDLDSAPGRRNLSVAPAVEPASVLFTVQIAVPGEALPPVAAGLFENLRALAAYGLATDVTVTPVPAGPAVPARPRLVRVPHEHRSPAGPEMIVVHAASRSVYREAEAVRLTRRWWPRCAGWGTASPRRPG